MTHRARRTARLVVALVAAGAAACRDPGVTPRVAVAGGEPGRGRALVGGYGCGGCHIVPGVPGAVGRVGPSLANFAGRAYLAGSLPNAPDTLVRWLRDPQALRPGTAMPDLAVSERDARDLAAYLYTLGEGGLGPPHLIPRRVLPAH